MDTFAYLVTFIALVPALALARVLSGVADLVQHGLSETPGRVRWSGLFLMLAIGVTTATSWEWWLLLNWRDEPNISFYWFQFLLIKPSILLIAARLLIPDIDPGSDVDLRQHYFAVARWVWPLLAMLPLLDLPTAYLGVVDQVGGADLATYTVVLLVFSAVCVSLGYVRRPWWHWTGILILNAILVGGQLYFGTGVLG
jgi:hypothetical protein